MTSRASFPVPERRDPAALAEAYAACLALARSHYENFPVASRLAPPALRPHIAAIYAFARIADDIADEPGPDPAARLAALDAWEAALHASLVPGAALPAAAAALPGAAPVFTALPETISAFAIDTRLLTDLLSAFRQDVTKTRYETWASLLDYCQRSANPVGRLMLRLAGKDTPPAIRSADALCTALQLTNFWQDLAVDWRRGRLYVPADLHGPAGADPGDLDGGLLTPAWQAALGEAAARTNALFDEGRAVCDVLDGRMRLELRATWLGGRRILDRLTRAGFDVFNARPALGATDALGIAWQVMMWRGRAG